MGHRYAVIDLGTNTFHLLIIEKLPNENLQEIFRERVFVKLASEGIENIGSAPFKRGLEAMLRFHSLIHKHQVTTIKAIGTAALRTADNGNEFIQRVLLSTGIQVEVVDGAEEARLIYQGVKKAFPFGKANSLIMDIGGGSVEFIIANQSGIKWSKSFPIGVAVLFKAFHKNDPITASEIQEINQMLNNTLHPLFEAIQSHPVHQLIGASGTFDVLELFLSKNNNSTLHTKISIDEYRPFSKKLMLTTIAERLALQGLPDSRADLIVVALVLIDFIVQTAKIKQIITSAYAMKEGVLTEMIGS